VFFQNCEQLWVLLGCAVLRYGAVDQFQRAPVDLSKLTLGIGDQFGFGGKQPFDLGPQIQQGTL
jgi:hypothetical protein